MSQKVVLGAVATVLALLWANQASALTLINRDAGEQTLHVTESDEDEVLTKELVIGVDQTLVGLCQTGGVVTMDNSRQGSFEGYEIVAIEKGRFVISEPVSALDELSSHPGRTGRPYLPPSFARITSRDFPDNSSNWLKAIAQSAQVGDPDIGWGR